MRFEVLLTEDATRDLPEICSYYNSIQATFILERLQAEIESLAMSPKRRSRPRELSILGIHEYRQVFFKPYRVM